MRRKPRCGFTLLETLVLMACLTLCMVTGTLLMSVAFHAERTAGASQGRVIARHELATQFRGDVARAQTRLERVGDVEAGPGCLILALPGGSHVIYHWSEATLERIERSGDKETRRRVPIGVKGSTIEFLRANDSGLVVIRILEPQGKGATRKGEISAALGGDLR